MDKFVKIKVADAVHQVFVPRVEFRATTDAAAQSFFVGQLTYLLAQVYETRYPNIVYNELIPVNTQGHRGLQNVAYRSFDGVTMAKFFGASGADLPRIATSATMTTVPVGYGGIESSWNLDEMYASQMLGEPLSNVQLRLAFRGYQEHAQNVALYGDKERGMGGLLNNENATLISSTVNWATVSDNQMIIDELDKAVKTVWNATKGVFLPNMLLIPAEKFTLISSKRMMAGTDTSILKWYMENNFAKTMGQELEIRPLFQLNAAELVKAGIRGTNGRIVAYRREADCLEMYQPLPFETLPAQFTGVEVNVPSHYKTSGTDVKQPLSMCYMNLI